MKTVLAENRGARSSMAGRSKRFRAALAKVDRAKRTP
jgi:hypothetical protein